MALVSQGWELVVTLMDSGLNRSTKTFELNNPADATAAAAAASTLLTRLNAVTDAEIVGYRLAEVFAEDAVSTPGASVQLEAQALITVGLASSPLKTASIVIPAPNAGIFQAATGAGQNIVDLTDSALVTYLNSFATGGLALVSDGEEVETNDFRRGIRRTVRKTGG